MTFQGQQPGEDAEWMIIVVNPNPDYRLLSAGDCSTASEALQWGAKPQCGAQTKPFAKLPSAKHNCRLSPPAHRPLGFSRHKTLFIFTWPASSTNFPSRFSRPANPLANRQNGQRTVSAPPLRIADDDSRFDDAFRRRSIWMASFEFGHVFEIGRQTLQHQKIASRCRKTEASRRRR